MLLILITLFFALAITKGAIRDGLDKLSESCKLLTIYHLKETLNCERTLEDLTQQLSNITNDDDRYEYLLQEIHAHIWSYENIIQIEEEQRRTPTQLAKERLKPLIDTDNMIELQGQ